MVYKILSLDGGGSWNLLQAKALKDIYGGATAGRDVLRNFDLAVANSGGSLVLAGLMLDRTPDQMIELVLDKTKDIFQSSGIGDFILRHLGLPVPQFSTKKKRQGLDQALAAVGTMPGAGALAMQEWGATKAPKGPNGDPVKALITAFDYDRERATFFRTFDSAGGGKASACFLLDVINASSNAPVVYFDEPAEFEDPSTGNKTKNRYWDGAIGGYNNPVMAGLTEVLAQGGKTRVDPKDIRVLAIGTANTRLAPPDAVAADPRLLAKRKSPGLVTDIRLAGGSVLDDPPDAANYVAFTVLSKGLPTPAPQPDKAIDSGSFVRLNPMLQPKWNPALKRWDPPAAYPDDARLKTFDRLANLSLAATDPKDLKAIEALFDFWKGGDVPNQPVLADRDTFELSIGDPTYAAAKARWLAF